MENLYFVLSAHAKHPPCFLHVNSHQGHCWNELADALAERAIHSMACLETAALAAEQLEDHALSEIYAARGLERYATFKPQVTASLQWLRSLTPITLPAVCLSVCMSVCAQGSEEAADVCRKLRYLHNKNVGISF